MRELRIIIAGSRDFTDANLLEEKCEKIIEEEMKKDPERIVKIISGGARGADMLGENFARKKGYELKRFPAKWMTYGKLAGPIRNREMLTYACQTEPLLIAFWDGLSRGTRNMIEIAKNDNVPAEVVYTM